MKTVEDIKQQHGKDMIWAYRQGYLSAIKTLESGLEELDEQKMAERFEQIRQQQSFDLRDRSQ